MIVWPLALTSLAVHKKWHYFVLDYFLTIEDRAEYQHEVTRIWLFCCYTKTKIQFYFLLSFLYESVSIISLLNDREPAVQNRFLDIDFSSVFSQKKVLV